MGAKRVVIKRLLISLISGAALPLFYFFALLAIDPSTFDASPTARKALLLPLYWPIVIYWSTPIYNFIDLKAVYYGMFIGNIALYGLLTYLFLWWASKRKTRLS